MFIHKGAALLVVGATLAALRQQRQLDRRVAGARPAADAGVARAPDAGPPGDVRGPTTIGLARPIGKPVPTGKKIAFISCGVQACEIQGNIIKQGAADLGWTASTISTDGSPEQLQNAFETALRQGADAVILNAVNRAAVAKQIAEAKQQGRRVRDLLQHRPRRRRDPGERRRHRQQREDRPEPRGRDRGRQPGQGEHALRQHLGVRDPQGARHAVPEHVLSSCARTAATPRSTSR